MNPDDLNQYSNTGEILRLLEDKFTKLFRSHPDSMVITTLKDGIYIDTNDSFLSFTGHTRDEVIGHSTFELGFWPQADERDKMVRVIIERGIVRDWEVPFITKQGELRLGLLSAERIKLGPNDCLIGTWKDVTDRKEMEKALQESQQFSSNLLRNAPNPILVINPDTSIRYANPALKELVGLSKVKLAGLKAPYPWWTEESIYNTVKALEHAMRMRRLSKHEGAIVTSKGRTLWIQVVSSRIEHEGKLKYYLESWGDVTEQKKLRDIQLLYVSQITKAHEEERKRIARELHDDIAQAIACLHMDILNLSNKPNELSADISEKLHNTADGLNRILDMIRDFSHELRPGLLDRLGLVPSLECLINDIRAREGVDCRIEVIGQERRLRPDVEVTLYRVCQEALRNVKKHAEASQAIIRIEFSERGVKAEIEDNGVGFRMPKSLSRLASRGKFGLIGMSERTRLVNGKFKVEAALGKGTRISALICS